MEAANFTRRIFIWHIATTIVYYNDVNKLPRGTCGSFLRNTGKSLSDYMMYLVLVRPSMLPNKFSEVVSKETYSEIQRETQRFFPQAQMTDSMSMKDFIAGLLHIHNDTIKLFSHRGPGGLYEGVRFAKQLQSLVRESTLRWDREDKWQMISKVWMDMMVYAASRCTWEEHAQQLRHGGELLTHISLLMAHLGLSRQVHRLEQSAEDHSHGLPFPDFTI
ncbi:hypothetical protein PTKIN_Ptkin02bG0222800 [Pterospermum kingtungense]